MILLLSAHDSLPALVSDTLEDQGYLGRLLDTLRERERERLRGYQTDDRLGSHLITGGHLVNR